MTYNQQMNYLDNVRTELKRMLRTKGDIFIDELVDQMEDTMTRKGDDYAGEIDRLANFKEAGYLAGITAEQQCLSLVAVKVARLGNLLNGKVPNFESFQDSLMDLTTYTVLLQMINDEPDNSPIKWWEK